MRTIVRILDRVKKNQTTLRLFTNSQVTASIQNCLNGSILFLTKKRGEVTIRRKGDSFKYRPNSYIHIIGEMGMYSFKGIGFRSTAALVAAFHGSGLWSLLITVASVAWFGSGMAQDWPPDNNRLYNIQDAAGMFNERGYAKANSFSLAGNEVVNDFNGNLMYTQRLTYLPISQNGLHCDLKLTYNGIVSHSVISARRSINSLAQTPMNLPEWIISLNGIAVQTFNFENEMISWSSTVGGLEDISISHDIAALINGYHTCYREANSNTNGVISILMGDGSVKELYSTSLLGGGFLNMKQGEYSTLSKTDPDRGYLWTATDSLYGYFTLFRSNGTKVHFKIIQPEFRSCQSDYGSQEKDYPRILLPVKFEDQMGHEISLTYNYAVLGRPVIMSAGDVAFSWNTWDETAPSNWVTVNTIQGFYRIDFASTPPDPGVSTIQRRTASWQGDLNRGLVYRIDDPESRITEFKYRSYFRRYQNTHFDDFFLDSRLWECDPPEPADPKWAGEAYEIEPWRLWQIRYPEGGYSYFQYYNDPLTEWGEFGYTGYEDAITINYDHTQDCSDIPLPKFPCKKSALFDWIGRDPFFLNMVVGVRHTLADTSVVSTDSLKFSWVDSLDDGGIGPEDQFETKRWFGKDDLWDLSPDQQIKERELTYRYFSEKGPLSSKSRNRGWTMKLMISTEKHRNYASNQITTASYWDIECDGPVCDGTYMLDSSRTTIDGESYVTRKTYEWFGDPADQKVINLIQQNEIDAWGIRTETFYDTLFLRLDGTESAYYNGSLVDSVLVKRASDEQLLKRSASEYYDGSTSDGYAGQVARTAQYLLDETGHTIDSVANRYTYFKSDALSVIHRGATKTHIDPMGHATNFEYSASTEIINCNRLAYDGSIENMDLEVNYSTAGPGWYRQSVDVGGKPYRSINILTGGVTSLLQSEITNSFLRQAMTGLAV